MDARLRLAGAKKHATDQEQRGTRLAGAKEHATDQEPRNTRLAGDGLVELLVPGASASA